MGWGWQWQCGMCVSQALAGGGSGSVCSNLSLPGCVLHWGVLWCERSHGKSLHVSVCVGLDGAMQQHGRERGRALLQMSLQQQ